MHRLFFIAVLLAAPAAYSQEISSFDQLGARRAVARIVNWPDGYHKGSFYTGTGTLTQLHGDKALVLTAAHIFEQGKGPITVEFYDGQLSGGRLLAVDKKLDVAAVLIFARAASIRFRLPTIIRRWATRWKSGAMVRAFPLVRGANLAADSAGRRPPQTLIGARGVNKGEVTIPGDSGGPVIREGRLVGVHWGYRSAATTGRCVHALGCETINGWIRGKVSWWQSPRLAGS